MFVFPVPAHWPARPGWRRAVHTGHGGAGLRSGSRRQRRLEPCRIAWAADDWCRAADDVSMERSPRAATHSAVAPFYSRERAGAYAARVLFLGGMIGFWFYTTQYLQGVLGMRPLQAGLAFLPAMLVPGHEIIGRVIEVGTEVPRFKLGDPTPWASAAWWIRATTAPPAAKAGSSIARTRPPTPTTVWTATTARGPMAATLKGLFECLGCWTALPSPKQVARNDCQVIFTRDGIQSPSLIDSGHECLIYLRTTP